MGLMRSKLKRKTPQKNKKKLVRMCSKLNLDSQQTRSICESSIHFLSSMYYLAMHQIQHIIEICGLSKLIFCYNNIRKLVPSFSWLAKKQKRTIFCSSGPHIYAFSQAYIGNSVT